MPDDAVFEQDVQRDWPRLNEQYVRRGGVVLDLSVLASWRNELEEMNRGKRGRPFEYPRSFISLVMFMRDVWRLTYRAAEGVLRVLGSLFGFEAPDYTTIWRREVEEEIGGLIVTQSAGHVLAADATGLSITTRGEYLAHKYRVPRLFVKLHAAVDVETGMFVAATATSGRKGDAGRLPGLIEQASKRLDGRIVEVLADGAYDTRDNFDMLKRRGIVPVIRMRKNANMKRVGGTSARPLAVHERNLLGEAYWCYVKRYGRRWSVEGAFSALKRTLGESLRSRRDDLMLKEALRKVAAYNRLLLA